MVAKGLWEDESFPARWRQSRRRRRRRKEKTMGRKTRTHQSRGEDSAQTSNACAIKLDVLWFSQLKHAWCLTNLGFVSQKHSKPKLIVETNGGNCSMITKMQPCSARFSLNCGSMTKRVTWPDRMLTCYSTPCGKPENAMCTFITCALLIEQYVQEMYYSNSHVYFTCLWVNEKSDWEIGDIFPKIKRQIPLARSSHFQSNVFHSPC